MSTTPPEVCLKEIDLEEGGVDDQAADASSGGVDASGGKGGAAGPAGTTASSPIEDERVAWPAGEQEPPHGGAEGAAPAVHGGDVEFGVPSGARQRRPEGVTMGDAMQGVGEDEKAYNYICNLDKVNLGGPGWFNDVFKVSVEVDSDRTSLDTLSLSLVPRNAFQRHCHLLDTSDHITGTVTVEAPAAKRVWLSGVTVTFEEHLITADNDTGELVGALEAQVASGQFVSGKGVFHFNLDLELLHDHRRWPVRETYVGDLMALRHRVIVSAQRPWYTFNVYAQVPLAMECLSRAPDEDAGQENEEGGPNHILIISDCNGRCEFDFGVDSFNLGDVISGTVRFTDVISPIVAGHVMLLKAEFMYGEASEVLVAEHTILGNRRREKGQRATAGLTEEERLRRQFMSPFVEQKDVHFVHTQEKTCRMEAVLGDAELDVEIPLHRLAITPSHMSLTQDIASVNDEAELVGVRYYIRLILEDNSQAAFWHTHEIFFHRSVPSPSSRGLGEPNSSNSSEDGYDSEEQRVEDDGNGTVDVTATSNGDRTASLGISGVPGRRGEREKVPPAKQQYPDEGSPVIGSSAEERDAEGAAVDSSGGAEEERIENGAGEGR